MDVDRLDKFDRVLNVILIHVAFSALGLARAFTARVMQLLVRKGKLLLCP